MAYYHNESAMVNNEDDHEDSPWMDDEEHQQRFAHDDTAHISEQEWNKLSERYSDAGYKEGISAGKLSTLQKGFDEGFTSSVTLSRRVGNLRGTAASLLALFTTTSASKHASPDLLALAGPDVVADLRQLVTALGKLDEQSVLPPDEEALEHAKSHGDNVVAGQGAGEIGEMRGVESLLEGFGVGGGGKKEEKWGVDECERRLGVVLERCGLKL